MAYNSQMRTHKTIRLNHRQTSRETESKTGQHADNSLGSNLEEEILTGSTHRSYQDFKNREK